jgi:hypothetical protein
MALKTVFMLVAKGLVASRCLRKSSGTHTGSLENMLTQPPFDQVTTT